MVVVIRFGTGKVLLRIYIDLAERLKMRPWDGGIDVGFGRVRGNGLPG